MEQEITEISREEFFCRMEAAEELDYVAALWKHGKQARQDVEFYAKSTNVIRNFPRGHKALLEMLDNIRTDITGRIQNFFAFGDILVEQQHKEGDVYYHYRYFRLKI